MAGTLASALLLAACGGSSSSSGSASSHSSSPPTRAQFVARADQFCRQQDARLAPLTRQLRSASSPKVVVGLLRQEETEVGSGLATLRAIPEPPADRQSIAGIIAQPTSELAMVARTATDLQQGHTAAFRSDAAQLKAIHQRYQRQAQSYGLHFCGQSTASVSSSDGSFATTLPAGFQDETSSAKGGTINVLLLAVGPRIDNETINVNVIREAAGGRTSIDEVGSAELKGIRALVPHTRSFSPLSSLTVGGSPARAVDYLGLPSGHLLHLRQVFVLHGGWIYTITYTALPSTYQAHLSAFNQIVNNWEWT
jgi:hypothetical protein